MYIVLAWLIGFLLYGGWLIFKMSGRDTGFDTTSNSYLFTIVLLSVFWPIHVPIVLSLKLRGSR